MKVLTVLGARPQFIKAATVSRAIKTRDEIKEIIIHTGQHFDTNMSDVFFDQLDIPKPNYNLGISALNHGAMTGRMLEKIEIIIQQEKPNWVLVYGDTNSTLAGALAASKLQVPVAHVEAGLRSHNPSMPEEINRILTDRVSSLLLCPTYNALKNLEQEGFPFSSTSRAKQHIENIGDVMIDALIFYRRQAEKEISLERFRLKEKEYALCTLHRQENTDNPIRLTGILDALRQISKELPIVLPLHPRTKAKLHQQNNYEALNGINLLDPLPYLEMQRLEMGAKLILTDSGGIQKEAYFHQVPCITLRDETEWIETVETGWNHLVGSDSDKIIKAAQSVKSQNSLQKYLYGDGNASQRVLQAFFK
jgi:UDP-GlcNAc3NAcA epimerase